MKYVSFDPSRPLDLIPLGRICIDFNPAEVNCTLAESQHFTKYVGGSPANIAVGMARLQKKVGFLGAVSDDSFGDYVEQYFVREGIDTSHLVRCQNGENMGLAFTEILSPEESRLLMYRNGVADLQLPTSAVDEEYIRSAKALLISGTALSASPSREAALKAVQLAKKTNTPVIFDIDYRAFTWKNSDETAVYYSLVAQASDIILGSREEFDLTERLMPGADGTDPVSARLWHGFGCRIVIIKHGKEGSTAYTCDGQNFSIRPFPVKCLKSFGGGDGYAAAFLYALMEDWPILDALEFGSASASMLVSAPSCSSSMPTVQEIRKFIEMEKAQYGEMIARV